MTLLTVPFILSAQSQGYYSHFTHLTTLCQAYYKATHVILGRCLRLMTLLGPSALNRHPMPITGFITGLHRYGCSRPPLPSSCQVVKQSLVHELVNVKLIVFSDVGGTLGAETGINP
jgi:hypothetical protein